MLDFIGHRLADEGDAQRVGGAVTRMRCPGLAKPSRKAMRQARSTTSSTSCASSVSTLCNPQTTATRRAVSGRGVRARIGVTGRSRAILSPVAPDDVQQTTAAVLRVSATCRAAAEMASGAVGSGVACWASMMAR
jgi:hypothetical protein